ncbi:hypothetical protein, partial [Dactylosporangium matsuzakiense]|uniref:hypothetical protein n=1 Tax=Dactylosporangium matsuzakiense TaxID=53360 RepID=UPI003F689BE7
MHDNPRNVDLLAFWPARHTPPHLPGPSRIQRWTGTDDWVVSTNVVHPALVSDADFVAVQRLAAAAVDDGPVHRYALVGLLAGWGVGGTSTVLLSSAALFAVLALAEELCSRGALQHGLRGLGMARAA